MLKRIDFSNEDLCYILGDVIDRGLNGVETLQYVMAHDNIHMLMGNHEYMMIDAMRHDGELHRKVSGNDPMKLWIHDNGGKVTHDALMVLDENEHEAILDFADGLEIEKHITLGEQKFILVHGRLNMTSAEKAIAKKHYHSLYSSYSGDIERVWGHYLPYYMIRDETVVYGHTVTSQYSGDVPSKIYKRNGSIGIDCGCAYLNDTGFLACLRLDDMREFYEPIDLEADVNENDRKRNATSSSKKKREIESDYEYEILEDDTVRIIRFVGNCSRLGIHDFDMLGYGLPLAPELETRTSMSIEVPGMIAGHPVSTIGDKEYYQGPFSGFGGCLGVISVNLPEGLTDIRECAFMACLDLQSLTIPSTVNQIGQKAFFSCNKLHNIKLPEGLQEISHELFAKCESLEEIIIPQSTAMINSRAFFECKQLKSVSFPANLRQFENDAFAGTQWLKDKRESNPFVIVNGILIDGGSAVGNVVVPDGVIGIAEYAFSSNKTLTGVTIPEGVEFIGRWAFSMCRDLSDVTIAKSVIKIGEYAFEWTKWAEDLMEDQRMIIVNGIVLEAKGTEKDKLDIPEGVKHIKKNALSSQYLRWIRIPESVTSLDPEVFRNIEGDLHVILPPTLEDIGDEPFKLEYGASFYLSRKTPAFETLKKFSHEYRYIRVFAVEDMSLIEDKDVFDSMDERIDWNSPYFVEYKEERDDDYPFSFWR
jgi:hypothetical protein